ncbi:hypothetical protein [Candidatus Poriferisodalis sp.]
MRAQRWGRIVMVASSTATYPILFLVDYGAFKAGNGRDAKGARHQVRP